MNRGRPILRMRWENLLFLHWRWGSDELSERLPTGLEVEEYGGSAWLGVVPFRMRRVRPNGLFCVPWISDFLELNVRTYVKGPNGKRGVWFFSLSCDQPLATWLARTFFALNYVHARMRVVFHQGSVIYSHKRGNGQVARYDYPAWDAVGGGTFAAQGSLEEFLAERYVLFSQESGGQLMHGCVEHEPYRIKVIDGGSFPSEAFLPAMDDGFEMVGRPPDHAMLAGPVDVSAWMIRPAT